jgi:Tfp pilus assembly protein FimT
MVAIAFPALSRFVPNQKVSSEAKAVDSYLQKARLRAANSQKPIRVVINCAVNPCWVELQTAVYTGSAVTSWQSESSDRHYFDRAVTGANSLASYAFDGATAAPAGVRYAIFMPDSRVYSDPKPFDIFFYHTSSSLPSKEGWRLSLSNDSGRVNTKRETLTIP